MNRIFILMLLLFQPIQGEGFIPGTLVKTFSGYTAIENIEPLRLVVCYNAQGKTKVTTVMHQVHKMVPAFRIISMQDVTVVTAHDQQFCLADGRWLPAKDLKKGDILRTQTGSIVIDAIKEVQQHVTMVYLQLQSPHTFYVTSSAILVRSTP